MNITGSPLNSVEDKGIDQPDHGAGILGQLIDGEAILLSFFLGNQMQTESFGCFFQNPL